MAGGCCTQATGREHREGDSRKGYSAMSDASIANPATLGVPMPDHPANAVMHPLERQLVQAHVALAEADTPYPTPQEFASDVKYAARVAVNLLDEGRSLDAVLRARDAVAYAGYGADYKCQPARVQNRINHLVRIAIDTYLMQMQGISEPLSASQRLALQPEKGGKE